MCFSMKCSDPMASPLWTITVPFLNRLKSLEATQIEEKQKQADSSFLEHGVTFTVYGDDEGTERIFPFDLIPRVS